MKAIVVTESATWDPNASGNRFVVLCDESKVDETIRNLGTEIEDTEVLDVY